MEIKAATTRGEEGLLGGGADAMASTEAIGGVNAKRIADGWLSLSRTNDELRLPHRLIATAIDGKDTDGNRTIRKKRVNSIIFTINQSTAHELSTTTQQQEQGHQL